MKNLATDLLRAAAAVVLLAIVCCALYPLAVWGFGRIFFAEKADGSLLRKEQRIIGSALIGQRFASPEYFHPRPSAVAYAASEAISGGSNRGPLSRALLDGAAARAQAYREENGLPASFPIPVDALNASASGLDPHISPANAQAQAARVARARGVGIDRIRRMIRRATEEKQLAILGERRVNVLLLNLAMDREAP
jgi:K+-transporting ATPase ATPase C chain